MESKLFPLPQRREDGNREGYKGDSDGSRCAARDPVMGRRWEELEVGFVSKVDEEGFRGVGESVDWLVGSGDDESVDLTGKQVSEHKRRPFLCLPNGQAKQAELREPLIGRIEAGVRKSLPSCLPTRTKGRVT